MEQEQEQELRRRLLDDAGGDDERPQRKEERKRAVDARMGLLDRLLLSPWDKWATHGRFPFKVALHAALLALTAAQMALYDAQNAAYMRASHRNWAYFFLPPANDIGTVARFQREIFTVNDTLNAVAFMRNAYFSIANDSVANYEYLTTLAGDVQPFQMKVTRALPHGGLDTREYSVSEHDRTVGPFDPSLPQWQLLHLARSLRDVEFMFPLRDRQYGNFYEECFEWQIHARLQVVESAQVHVQIEDCDLSRCRSNRPMPFWSAARQRFLWLHLVIAVLCTLYMILSVKALRRSVRMVRKARILLTEQDPTAFDEPRSEGSESGDHNIERAYGSWRDVPFSLKMKLFNAMQIVVFLSLILLLISSVWSLVFLKAHVPIHFGHRLLHATALLLLWSTTVGYLSHNRNIYSIVLTLKWGAPRVLQFLIGVSPIFIGFALFGTIYFGNKIKMFGTVGASMTTLFSILNGDEILDTFDAMNLHGFSVSGKVFLYTFISLFIYVVLNIFIAIVEEAFFATRSTRRTLSVLLSDPQLSRAQFTQEGEVSAELLRLLLRVMDAEEKGRDAEALAERNDQ